MPKMSSSEQIKVSKCRWFFYFGLLAVDAHEAEEWACDYYHCAQIANTQFSSVGDEGNALHFWDGKTMHKQWSRNHGLALRDLFDIYSSKTWLLIWMQIFTADAYAPSPAHTHTQIKNPITHIARCSRHTPLIQTNVYASMNNAVAYQSFGSYSYCRRSIKSLVCA